MQLIFSFQSKLTRLILLLSVVFWEVLAHADEGIITTSEFSLGNVIISNVQLSPKPPVILSIGERVDISFDYSIVSPSVCTYIWVDPYSNGQRIPSGTEPSYCNTGKGKGSGFFEPMEGSEGTIVDSLGFVMHDGNKEEDDEYYYSLPINYSYTIEDIVEANQLPIAEYYASPSNGSAPLTVYFDASPSYDPDGFIANYEWAINRQILIGKAISFTFEEANDYPYLATLTVTDDKGETSTVTYTITVTQPNNEIFCTSGNANVNNVSIGCVNGNCSSVGIKITCNSQSCQWCDGNDNCGNIVYNGITEITSGTINCKNGQCNYHTQSEGSSSSGSFSCKNNSEAGQTTIKVEPVNPVTSQTVYLDGDTVKITIPQTIPAELSQYFGVGLPNESGIFVANNLNEFQVFNSVTLPEWRGGETAVDIPVTQDLPRGAYDAYLLRSLKGVDPLTAGSDKAALGITRFFIMDEIKVTQITDPDTELGFVATTGKETIGVLGKKDKEGRLIDINRIFLGSQTDTNQNLSITLDNDYLPKTMEFPDGSQIEFSNYTDTGATATYRSASGNIINELDIPLQVDDLQVAVEAIKQFQNSPQPTLNNPVPTVMGTIGSPTDSNCLEIATAVHKRVKAFVSGVSQIASTMSCAVTAIGTFFTGGAMAQSAGWACSSTLLGVAKMIGSDKFESLIEQIEPVNDFVQGVSSCIRKDWFGCVQFVVAKFIDGALDQLKPENVCKEATTTAMTNIDVGRVDFSGFDCGLSLTNFKVSSNDGKNHNISFDFEDTSGITSNQFMQISFTSSCNVENMVSKSDVANLVFSGEEHGHKETSVSSFGAFSCIVINNGLEGCAGKTIPVTLTQPQPSSEPCTENTALKQWCLKNSGTWFDTINACQILSANKELANQCNSPGMNSRIEDYFMGVLNCYSTDGYCK